MLEASGAGAGWPAASANSACERPHLYTHPLKSSAAKVAAFHGDCTPAQPHTPTLRTLHGPLRPRPCPVLAVIMAVRWHAEGHEGAAGRPGDLDVMGRDAKACQGVGWVRGWVLVVVCSGVLWGGENEVLAGGRRPWEPNTPAGGLQMGPTCWDPRCLPGGGCPCSLPALGHPRSAWGWPHTTC